MALGKSYGSLSISHGVMPGGSAPLGECNVAGDASRSLRSTKGICCNDYLTGTLSRSLALVTRSIFCHGILRLLLEWLIIGNGIRETAEAVASIW